MEFQGEKILTRVVEPLFAACRVLKERELTGTVEMWDRERPFPRMVMRIERGAGLAVDDGEQGPKITKFKPFPGLE